METEDEGAALNPSFFKGRMLVEILSWEWVLGVGLSRIGPRKYRFQGGLDLARTITMEGRIQAPQEHRGRDIEVSIYPIHRRMRFGRFGLKSVGSVQLLSSAPEPGGCRANLLLPEMDLPMLAVALSTKLRYLDLWTRGFDVEVARVTNYGFSSTIGDKVKPWAGVD
jgi:hypothetical protein